MSFEDRQDLLGHKSGRITTHYSAAELHKLIEATNKVCDQNRQSPVLTLLRINCASNQVITTEFRRNPTVAIQQEKTELKVIRN